MSADRQSVDAMVCEYLAAGGRIRKLPGAISATRDEVLRYLKAQKVYISPARRKNAKTETKYSHGVDTISSNDLVQLANVHRRKQRLLPFELT